MTAFAWKYRQPLTTSDFTLFYRSAAAPPSEMFKPPPGPPRNNMNPPHVQLLMRPLTLIEIGTASAIFRGLNVVAALACLWFLSRASAEPWTLADAGALLAWSAVALHISLNQNAWIMWPLLVHAWWCWRRGRWTAGAVSFGVALSMKAFLGVFLIWLVVSRRWLAAVVAAAIAAACFLLGILVYGIDVFRDWTRAVSNIDWWRSSINGSFQGFLARTIAALRGGAVDFPAWAAAIASIAGLAILAISVWRTRGRSIDDSWTPLMAGALLASPLGWLYYGCWLLPNRRPYRMLMQAPLLWVPIFYHQAPPTLLNTLTYHSMYFWGFALVWVQTLLAVGRTADKVERR